MAETLATMRWVVGFIFNAHHNVVLLIRKVKPAWQAGKLNGPGGSIEPGETPVQAIVREVREETGLEIAEGDWHNFLIHRGDDRSGSGRRFEIHFFRAVDIDANMIRAQSFVTPEQVSIVRVDALLSAEVVPSLPWHVAMAVSFARGERKFTYEVEEPL